MKITYKLAMLLGAVGLMLTISCGRDDPEPPAPPENPEETPTVIVDGANFSINGVSYEMVPVAGGTFAMGSTAEQLAEQLGEGYIYEDAHQWCLESELPAHEVTLSSYYIGKTEVTQALWEAVMGSNPSNFEGDNLPVEEVSWSDCQEFILELNRLTGKQFRLPTEAEWEYAARGGNQSKGYIYSGSNNANEVAWCDGGNGTHPVGTKQPNELGLYDMSGNVWEWCADWYGGYSSGAQTDPTGPASGSDRVERGGSWNNDAWLCRSTGRFNDPPSFRVNFLGLRLALTE